MAPIAHYLARVKARMIELGFTLDEDACQLLKGLLAVRSPSSDGSVAAQPGNCGSG